MPRKRRFRKRRGSPWTSESSKRANKARWDAVNRERDEEEPRRLFEMALADSINLPRRPGDPTHGVQITDFATGEVFRWVAEIGPRRDQVVFRAHSGARSKPSGWTWFLDHLRPYLCGNKLPRSKFQVHQG